MSLVKKYDKKKSTCSVTFIVDNELAHTASQIYLAGDFNDWEIGDIAMKRQQNGVFVASLELEKNKEYQFRYLIDAWVWLNEDDADRFVFNGPDRKNSVVVV